MSQLDADKLTLDKLLTFIEGKESGEASQGLLANSAVGVSNNAVNLEKKCGYCGDIHKRGKKFCKAANFKCDCGKIGHFTKVCRSKGKVMKSAQKDSECLAQDDTKEQVDAAWGVPDGHWACQIDSEQPFKLPESLDFIENKYPEMYSDLLRRVDNNVITNKVLPKDKPNSSRQLQSQKSALTKKVLPKNKPYSPRQLGFRKSKMMESVEFKSNIVESVLFLMATSTFVSTVGAGDTSLSQSALATNYNEETHLSHHVYDKKHGWLKQGSKQKPLLSVEAKVDIPAYLTLRIRVPNTPVRSANGHCLADTGASVCLAGVSFMKSLGLSQSHLTPCDMSVTGANASSINVLGAILVEFRNRLNDNISKQVVYICEGVSGALLSLEACNLVTL